jgi:hypothetical protein
MSIHVIPDWMLVRLGIPQKWRYHVGAFLSAGLALFLAPVLIRIPHVCLFQTLLHIPCPGCGVLHAIQSCLGLHFAAAWRSNPGGIFVAVAFLLELFLHPLAMAWPALDCFADKASQYSASGAMAVLLYVWGSE